MRFPDHDEGRLGVIRMTLMNHTTERHPTSGANAAELATQLRAVRRTIRVRKTCRWTTCTLDQGHARTLTRGRLLRLIHPGRVYEALGGVVDMASGAASRSMDVELRRPGGGLLSSHWGRPRYLITDRLDMICQHFLK